MHTFIALLRGINVSGKNIIKMADLRQFLEELNFKNIITYIQSGNIIFDSKISNIGKLEKSITEKINEHYGFNVEVIVITPTEIEYVLNNNVYANDNKKDPKRIYITFLQMLPTKENIENLKSIDHLPEEFIIDGKIIFGYSPNGLGNAKVNNNYIQKKLKVSATSRNWQTINKLFELTQNN